MRKLFTPIKIGKMEVKNRIVGAPTVMQYVHKSGDIMDEFVEIYRERSAGGVGLVIVEATAVRLDGVIVGYPMPTLLNEKQMEGMKRVADAIHKGGAKAAVQLVHAGRAGMDPINYSQPVAPSVVPCHGMIPRELTADECRELIECHGRSALLAKEAGFDCVHYHAAHGWLLQQFLSPYTNKRTDEYGDRYKFISEVVEITREKCGKDFPIIFRISAEEYIGEQGITLDMTLKEVVPALHEMGIDCIDVSVGTIEPYSMYYFVQPLYLRRGIILHYAEEVKKVSKLPVIGVGRINDPKLAEKIIEEGRVDLVSMSRGLLADPEFPRKTQEKHYNEIRKCLACDACAPSATRAKCAINPNLARLISTRAKKSSHRKKVIIVGGGVAGLEASHISAWRGHNVTLFEKNNCLGGLVLLASSIPRVYTKELKNIVLWLEREIRKQNVKINLDKEITGEEILSFNPDAVIVAVGSMPKIPDIKGAKNNFSFTVDDYLSDSAKIGEKVAVIGGIHGAEVALSLARLGRKVTILEKTNPIMLGEAPYMARTRVFLLKDYLEEAGVNIIKKAQIQEIVDNGKKGIKFVLSGKEEFLEIDSVLFAEGRQPNKELANSLREKIPLLFEVGDCVEPRRILNAIHEGYEAAAQI